MDTFNIKELGFSQVPHYCTHAVEFYTELALTVAQHGIRPDMEEFLVELMASSVKFLLPDNGYLFAEHDFKPKMFELQRLPYPTCALEFFANQELYAADSGLHYSAKRIAICFDPHQLPDQQRTRLCRLLGQTIEEAVPPDCLAITCVYDADGVWGAACGIVVIDLANSVPLPIKDAPKDSLVEAALDAGMTHQLQDGEYGLPSTFCVYRGRARLAGLDAATAARNLYIDTVDEVRTVYEFLAAINCSNVGTRDVPAPKVLNARRGKNGRTLFYPYKVLNLAPTADEKGVGAGAHASPRAHLRRGHIRQLGERFGNKALWINATMVNARLSDQPVATVYKLTSSRP